ncbi:MAG: hypothetical protein LC792_21495 [Actinobacteria bacterium]|nr:hypothetical protein [Actinomycetota bacterium]
MSEHLHDLSIEELEGQSATTLPDRQLMTTLGVSASVSANVSASGLPGAAVG